METSVDEFGAKSGSRRRDSIFVDESDGLE